MCLWVLFLMKTNGDMETENRIEMLKELYKRVRFRVVYLECWPDTAIVHYIRFHSDGDAEESMQRIEESVSPILNEMEWPE